MATSAELAVLEEHIKSCASCRAYKAFSESSRSALSRRPRREVPQALSDRLMNAIATERELESRNIRRGGGIGTPAGLRLNWVGSSALVAACAAGLFAVFLTRHQSITVPVSYGGTHIVATLQSAAKQKSASLPPLLIAQGRHAEMAFVPTSPISNEIRSEFPHIRHSDRIERAWTPYTINLHESGNGVGVEVASLPKSDEHKLNEIKPALTNTHSSSPSIETIASVPKRLPSATPSIISNPPSAPTNPVQVASLGPSESQLGGDNVIAPVASETQHSQLVDALHQLARHTEMGGEATVALASMNGQIDYSDSVELVGSAVH
jgi:hypothetical protein